MDGFFSVLMPPTLYTVAVYLVMGSVHTGGDGVIFAIRDFSGYQPALNGRYLPCLQWQHCK